MGCVLHLFALRRIYYPNHCVDIKTFSSSNTPKVFGRWKANSNTLGIEGSGTVELRAILPDETTHILRLRNVLYIQSYPTNIFSAALLYRGEHGYLSFDGVYARQSLEGDKHRQIAKMRATKYGLFLCLVKKQSKEKQRKRTPK